MGIRSLWSVIPSTLLLMIVQTDIAFGFQGNAVAGSVRTVVKVEDKVMSVPLEGVTVEVVQDTSINNVSRKDDGIFVLYVPASSYKQFDLLYTKENYCTTKRKNIANGDRHKKIDVVTMVPETQVSNLSDEEKQQLLNDSAEIYGMSKQDGLTAGVRAKLRTAAVRNLELLRSTVAPSGSPIARPNAAIEERINRLLHSSDDLKSRPAQRPEPKRP